MIDRNMYTRIVMREGTKEPTCGKNDYVFV
jgi:hypothetical protein